MAKETMIIFVYDTEYCKDESHDPINAVLYFHPSWVSDIQKVALCGQLMGTSQFLKHCFFRPKIIALQNGKFVFREFGRFVVAIGTDRNISDFLLEHRAYLLTSLIEFFHRDLQTIYDQFPSNNHHRNVSEKLYHIFGTYLPILQYNGNIFRNVPKLRIPKIASNIFLNAMHTLQNCQQTKGVLGGALLYHNKIVASQLSDNVTKNIVFTDPHRITSTAETINVNFHVPVGVQMIFVYISVDQFNILCADAHRSQTLQTQHLTSNAIQGHLQKRKMKRDRSIIFSNIPEEHSCDQTETEHIQQTAVVVKTKKIALRPTHLPLKEVITPCVNEHEKSTQENNNYPEYIGRTSVCLTPMTENKILQGNGIMSICANTVEDVSATKPIRYSFKIDFDKMFSKLVNNSPNIERRNSFTDLQDSVKKISKKFSLKKTLSSYKIEFRSPDDEKMNTISRTTSDPTHPILSGTETSGIFDQFLREYRKDSNIKTEEEAVELAEDTIKCNNNSTDIALNLETIPIECSSYIDKGQIPKSNEFKTLLQKKSLSLPLKTHSDIQTETATSLKFGRKSMTGIQLTPLMAKLSVLAHNEERHVGYNRLNSSHAFDYTINSDEKDGGKMEFQKVSSSAEVTKPVIGNQKVELYICGQENMSMFLLLEQGSTQKQEIVQSMFDKCVAKLGKMESHLYQTLNVNMMEGVSEGIYSLICVDSKWDTLLNHGPWTPLDQSFLEHMRTDLSTGQLITDIFLRIGDCILYGYKSGRTEFFFKESAHYFTGIPPPSDPMGTIAKRAKLRLEEDFSIVLF